MSRIIVGIDGSANARDALAWAVARSELTGQDVLAVFVWHLFEQGRPGRVDHLQPEFGEDDARALLDHEIAEAGLTGRVEGITVHGAAAESLVETARDGDLIVVGARGLGGFKGLLLGSVSTRVLQLAKVPVAVIREDDRSVAGGDVVVGVDGSPGSLRALTWAADEARVRGARLRVVLAWQAPLYPEMSVPQILEALEEGVAEQAAEIVADAHLDDLEVVTVTPCSGATQALLAQDAVAILVVGSRGHGRLAQMFLGSVSREVARHATVPVVLVH